MILKKAGNIIGLMQRKKNIFVLDLKNTANRIMIAQEKGRPIHLLSKNPEVRLWYCRFAHISNAWIIQALKLVDGIKLSNVIISNSNDD